VLTGCLIAESLRAGAELSLPPGVLITRITRQDVSGSTTAAQPDVWTLINFSAPGERAAVLAEMLAGALSAEHGGWYADFSDGRSHTIVFPGRVFTYTIGDRAGRAEAVDYGLRAGIPESQLDWGD
jgi:hypothetical protein